ncbi:MAG: GAF domain-containing protein [Cyanobacteria bacterium P01_H01_bin.121]
MVTISVPASESPDFDAVRADLVAIKAVFESARGPSVAKLQERVRNIERFLEIAVHDPPRALPTISSTHPPVEADLEHAWQTLQTQTTELWQQLTPLQTQGLTRQLQCLLDHLRLTLNLDRVVLYRLEQTQGRAIAEALASQATSVLGSQNLVVPAQSLNVTVSEPALSLQVADLQTQAPKFWAAQQVQAALAVPILLQQNVWGVLVCQQCTASRNWQQAERAYLQQASLWLSWVLQNSQLQAAKATLRQQAEQIASQNLPPAASQTDLEFEPRAQASSQQLLPDQLLIEQILNLLQESFQTTHYASDRYVALHDTLTDLHHKFQLSQHFTPKVQEFAQSLESLGQTLQVVALNATLEGDRQEPPASAATALEALTDQLEQLAHHAKTTQLDLTDWAQDLQAIYTEINQQLQAGPEHAIAGKALLQQIQKSLKVMSKLLA